MTLVIFCIVDFDTAWRSRPYLEDGKKIEYDNVKDARAKIRQLEKKFFPKLFAWKREQIEV